MNAKIAWETKRELDELRTALSNVSRERGGFSQQQVIYFETSGVELSDAATGTLDEVAQVMTQHGNSHVMVTGYADARASQLYNVNLSRDRAQAAATYLADKGVDPSRVRAMGLGPIGPMGDGVTLADYRRVEVFVWD